MKRLSELFSPTNWIYILVHFCLILFGFILVGRQDTTAKAIGASLVAAGLAGWVVLAWVLQAKKVSDQIRKVRKFGFLDAFEARSVRIKSQYDARLANASHHIDLLGFGLKTLREDYARDFATWKERVPVRILVIDPEYPQDGRSYADQRDAEERDRVGSIREDVEAFLREVEPLLSQPGGHPFEVRLYRCLPSLNLFRVDSELFWGPYLIHKQSRNSPTFIVQEGPLFNMLMAHFDAIWFENSLSHSVADYRSVRPRTEHDPR
jgi:hypothetical protein